MFPETDLRRGAQSGGDLGERLCAVLPVSCDIGFQGAHRRTFGPTTIRPPPRRDAVPGVPRWCPLKE